MKSSRRGEGSIWDDTVIPVLSIGDVTVREEAGTASFPVTLSTSASFTSSVNYTTANGTAVVDEDFGTPTGTYANQVSDTLTFTPGQTQKTIDVPIHDDDLVELTEVLFVRLSNPVNVTAADLLAVGTIEDNDLDDSSVRKSA